MRLLAICTLFLVCATAMAKVLTWAQWRGPDRDDPVSGKP